MSKSLRRVVKALADAGLDISPIEMSGETRTAQQAADQARCALDQIAKSIVFEALDTSEIQLFITAGGKQVDPAKSQALVGAQLGRADARKVRNETGFAIGGVAPIGHLSAPMIWFDQTLLSFDVIWAAAGTPRHIFPIAPTQLVEISGAHVSDFTS